MTTTANYTQTYAPEADFGTPASGSQVRVTVTIDGRPVTVPAGTSVLRAALESGIDIPRLCATDTLAPFGSCRLCVVEIDGMRGRPRRAPRHAWTV